jgi:uncharacterized protein (TIGR02996 family)
MLDSHPRVLALLEEARLAPHDDSPRLVLADWLEDHGDADRAELLRLQCRHSRQTAAQERCRALLDKHGGAWLGPLWRWPARRLGWHRGLLTLRPAALGDHAGIDEVLPWVDALLLSVACREGLRRSVGLLGASAVNHAALALKQGFREATLLAELSRLPESPFLRTLSFDLPYRMLCAAAPGGPRWRPAFSDGFLGRLLAELPACRRLTHLAADPAWGPGQASLIRSHGVEPAHASHDLWMHDLPPTDLKDRGHVKAALCGG